MTKKPKVARPNGELMQELKDQIKLVENDCSSFDNGMEIVGKRLALSLRILLHHRGQSQALLEQLGLRSGRYLDTAGPLNPRNMLTECNLVQVRVAINQGGTDAIYIPLGDSPNGDKWVPFDRWWNEPVLKDSRKRQFNRRELIQHVADTDGGAHVDPELDQAYMDLSRANSLGWRVGTSPDNLTPLRGRPELACMRQICHELLRTMRRRQPSLFA